MAVSEVHTFDHQLQLYDLRCYRLDSEQHNRHDRPTNRQLYLCLRRPTELRAVLMQAQVKPLRLVVNYLSDEVPVERRSSQARTTRAAIPASAALPHARGS